MNLQHNRITSHMIKPHKSIKRVNNFVNSILAYVNDIDYVALEHKMLPTPDGKIKTVTGFHCVQPPLCFPMKQKKNKEKTENFAYYSSTVNPRNKSLFTG